MRTLRMALFGVVLLAVPLLAMIGPVELVILMAPAALWLVALVTWAILGDRRAKQEEPSLGWASVQSGPHTQLLPARCAGLVRHRTA